MQDQETTEQDLLTAMQDAEKREEASEERKERDVEIDGYHHGVIVSSSTGGDLAIELDPDDFLWMTEDLSDEIVRGIIRFGYEMRKSGEIRGRIDLKSELRRLIGAAAPSGRLSAGSLSWLFRECERRARILFKTDQSCRMAILGEEIGEVVRETGPRERFAELVQVAAVALSWAQVIEEEQL